MGLGVAGRTFRETETRNVFTPMLVILGKQHGLGTGFVGLKSFLVPPTSGAAQSVATKITTAHDNESTLLECEELLLSFMRLYS